MKSIAILASLAALLILIACREPIPQPKPLPDPEQGCDFYNQHPDWVEEDFKRNYTIRFTPDYTGGITGFEGNIFSKSKNDSTINLGYAYCGPLWCPDFGDTLVAPLPTDMYIPKFRMQNDSIFAAFSQTIYQICDSLQPVGVLYYTDETGPGEGNFYMGNPDSLLLEGLQIQYRAGALAEVFTILSTIEER